MKVLRALGVGAAVAVAVAAWAAGPAQERLVVGLKAFQDGFHDLAAKELRAFLQAVPADPRRAEVLRVLARAEVARKNWAGARSAYEELAAGKGPGARQARYDLAWVLAQEGKGDAALARLDAYLAEPGGDRRADALVLAARLGREADPAGAARRLGEFLAAAPGDPRRAVAWAEAVELRLAAGDPAGARDAARQAVADPAVRASPAAHEAVALAGAEASRR
ncbi:MAG: tetratricopeptide repeat protein, partial [Deferrisomatales bacterium]